MSRSPAPPPRGILERAAAPDGTTAHERIVPHPALAPFIEHFWSVRWDLRSPFVAETLPHPSAHLVFETSSTGRTRAEVTGFPTGRFVRTLKGRGAVFGIKFRPATFQPLLKRPMSTLTDRVVSVKSLLGAPGEALSRSLLASMSESLEPTIAVAEAYLHATLPSLPVEIARLRDLVAQLATDRTITRVEDAAALVSLDVRTLQRRFGKYVGVSPKWVIQRYRLHEAAAQLARPDAPSLAAIAASLGYFDQPHFVRDFKAVVGHPPGQYRDR